MTWQSRGRRSPPWWPEGEPWPPAGPRAHWRRGRARFVRRIALVFATLLVLGALGLSTLLSMLFNQRGFPGLHAPLAIVGSVLVMLAAVLAVAIRRVGSPLGDVVEAANRVAAGDYSVRIVEHGPPSLRTMGRAFNSMTSRLESQDRLRRQLMADIAHELRTPLSVMQGRVEGLIDGVYPIDRAQLGHVLAETRVLARLVEDLRTLAHAEGGTLRLEKEPTDVAVLLRDVVDAFASESESGQVSMQIHASAGLPLVMADPLRLREIAINLISNALHHSKPGGRISIDLSAANDQFTVAVSDTGSGVAPEDLPKIFDRFYKSASSRGSGLGLAIVRNLVVAHGGGVEAHSEPGRGTVITFTLPIGES